MRTEKDRPGYVYILLSLKDFKQYIGSTINVEKRLQEHNEGKSRSTSYRRPFKIKHILKYESIKLAAQMEKKFKRSHGALERELKRRKLI